jgi:hypothetical protein
MPFWALQLRSIIKVRRGMEGSCTARPLPAGNLTLRVELAAGVWQQPVTITSNQAAASGNLAIDLSKVTR